ncbi:DNA adenine methylase [Apilactobacillus micheneri]|uniref:DNA adenine methylase n=1 Tax=Apilactobacillus micheneri TaxID=1899430 RepID=UPI00112E73F0|nr:DNA adenine methylase [Apilactobacillus micheneri]TPR45491.1 DNA adenine methylase [Apilactobacillus micheneri]TPR48937.1 DNA adenine methylase [Apilactobacillus micheneri]
MLEPLLKYPGGKSQELRYILPLLPRNIDNYYEPFVGAGSVYLSIDKILGGYYINDKSRDLYNLYLSIRNQDSSFFKMLNNMDKSWQNLIFSYNNMINDLISIFDELIKNDVSIDECKKELSKYVIKNSDVFIKLISYCNYCIEVYIKDLTKSLTRKINFLKKKYSKSIGICHQDKYQIIETAIRSSIYTYNRYLYNNGDKFYFTIGEKAALYLNVREYCYSSMFRYNKEHKFNVPYGGMSYNDKFLKNRIKYYKNNYLIKKLSKTKISCNDFYNFMNNHYLNENDFVFLDPPYDTEFSTYDQNTFDKKDQIRLSNYLIYECKAKWMMIIKNTNFISSLYPKGEYTANNDKIYVSSFDKLYRASFMNRNNRITKHLVITNYPTIDINNVSLF